MQLLNNPEFKDSKEIHKSKLANKMETQTVSYIACTAITSPIY